MIRVVVFDFDGTLVDSNAIKCRCFDEVVAGLPGGPGALSEARATGGDRYQIFQRVARRLNPEGSCDDIVDLGHELAADYTQRCLRAIASAPERRGARASLHALKQKRMNVWINSATPKRDLPRLLHARKLVPLVDGALGAPRSKAQNLRSIMAVHRAAPRQVVMIGDGPDDDAASRAAGTWFIAVTAEKRIGGRFAVPDLVELPAVIDRLTLLAGARSR